MGSSRPLRGRTRSPARLAGSVNLPVGGGTVKGVGACAQRSAGAVAARRVARATGANRCMRFRFAQSAHGLEGEEAKALTQRARRAQRGATGSVDSAGVDAKGQQLERTLTLRGAVTLNLLDMIGVGPFITLPLLIGAMGGPQAMVGWVLGAVLAACDGMVWAELGAAMPEAGGTYAYLEQMYPGRVGRWLSFLFAFQLLLSAPLSVASGCIGVAAYAGSVVPGLRGHAVWAAVASVVVAVALQYRRLSGVKRVAQGLLVIVMATIAWTVVTGLWHGEWPRVVAVPSGAFHLDAGFFAGLASAMLIATYDYWGYYNVTFLGGEAKDPGRTIPRAVLLSIAIVALLYLALNASVVSGVGAPGGVE